MAEQAACGTLAMKCSSLTFLSPVLSVRYLFGTVRAKFLFRIGTLRSSYNLLMTKYLCVFLPYCAKSETGQQKSRKHCNYLFSILKFVLNVLEIFKFSK